MSKKNGIFCLETRWTSSVSNKNSVKPILELIEKQTGCRHIYHNCATRNEMEFMLKKWKTKKVQDSFPILYFAFHGKKGTIKLNSDHKGISLEELAEILENCCERKILFFASCETLNIPPARSQEFLARTGALAAIGYKSEVDWMIATAFELLVLDKLHMGQFDTVGINAMKSEIESDYKSLRSKLKSIIIINNRRYPRKRS
jgi:hypothetical protein